MSYTAVGRTPIASLVVSGSHSGPSEGRKTSRKGPELEPFEATIETLSKRVISLSSTEEYDRLLLESAGEYAAAKFALVQSHLAHKWSLESYRELSEGSLAKEAEFFRKKASKKISKDSFDALLKALTSFSETNHSFLNAAQDSGALSRLFLAGDQLQRYFGCVLAFEMTLNALHYFFLGKAKPRVKSWPESLVNVCQSLGENLLSAATQLKLIESKGAPNAKPGEDKLHTSKEELEISPKIVVTEETMNNLTQWLETPGEPTAALRELMAGDDH